VADIRLGTDGSGPNSLYVWNDKLYFSANDGTNGTELWVYEPDPIPEPASLLLVGTGLPALIGVARRRRYQKSSPDTGICTP